MVSFRHKAASQADAGPRPDGSSQHYQLLVAAGDNQDMLLRNANGLAEESYYLHIVREGEDTTAHAVLHNGTAPSDPVAASSIYSTHISGSITAQGQALPWDMARHTLYGSVTVASRSLRWYKSYESKPGAGILKTHKPGSIVWTLHDLTDAAPAEGTTSFAPYGPTLAALTLAPLQGKHSHAETGNLVWFTPGEKGVQDAAVMLVLTLWHRDRQIRLGGRLDPRGEVKVARRTLETEFGGIAGAGMAVYLGASMGGLS